MDKIIKALIGLIFAFIALVGIFGILPQLGLESPFANFQNPLAGLFEQGKNAAANAALNAFSKELLAAHIRTCVAQDIREGRDATIDELVATLQKLMK